MEAKACRKGELRNIETGVCDTTVGHLKRAIREKQYFKVKEEGRTVLVDMQTANAILTVRDALSAKSREKFNSMSLSRQGAIAWKLVK